MLRLVSCCVCSAIVGLVLPGAADAGVFNVSNTADAVAVNPSTGCATASGPPTNGACTLRSAVQAANAAVGSSTINLAPGTYTLTIGPPAPETTAGEDASKGDLEITNTSGTITVAGAGSGSTTIDANSVDRAFDARPGTDFALTGVTVRNGRTGGFSAGTSCPTPDPSLPPVSDGGAIDASGTLTLSGDVFSGNVTLGNGGAIATESSTAPFVMNSTIVDSNLACPRDATGSTDGGGIAVLGGAPATIDSSTLSNNSANGIRAVGGGLSEEGADVVTITRSSISGNSADGGGGGVVGEGGTPGALHFVSDTISGNTARGMGTINGMAPGGGGVFNDGSDNDTYVNTTITGNHAPEGGGIFANSGASDTLSFSTVTGNRADSGTGNITSVTYKGFPSKIVLDDTIVAGGIGTGTPSNCGGPSFTSNGHNLFDDSGASCGATASDLKNTDPKLGPLADNGGPTQTQALQPGSPALDAADDSRCGGETSGLDQRGVSRPQGPHCDIGAYERALTSPGATSPGASSPVRTKPSPLSACSEPAGKLAGTELGFFKLGMTIRTAEKIVPKFRKIGFGFIDFCLYPRVGLGIRINSPSPRLLARIPKRRRAGFKDRIVIALTNNSFYALSGIRPGTKLRSARKKLHLGRPFFIGRNVWYIVPGQKANGLLKVRHNVILEVGLANKQLSSGSYDNNFHFLTSWKHVP